MVSLCRGVPLWAPQARRKEGAFPVRIRQLIEKRGAHGGTPLQSSQNRSTPHPVSPTVFRKQGFRFSFFSNEEPRMHIHVYCANGQAKFWLEPVIEVAENDGLRLSEIRKAQNIIEENEDEIRRRWQSHFGS